MEWENCDNSTGASVFWTDIKLGPEFTKKMKKPQGALVALIL